MWDNTKNVRCRERFIDREFRVTVKRGDTVNTCGGVLEGFRDLEGG